MVRVIGIFGFLQFVLSTSSGHDYLKSLFQSLSIFSMTGATETTAPRARRPAVVCDQCRTRKLKCDRKFPCSRCLKAVDHRICSYTKAPGPKAQTVNCAEIPVSLQSLDPRTAASEPTVVNFDTTPVQERNIESQYPQRRYTEDQNKAHDIFPSWCYHGQGSWQSLLRHVGSILLLNYQIRTILILAEPLMQMNGFYDYVHEAIISVPATLKNHNQIVTRIAGAYIQNEPQPETAELTDLCSLIPDHDISVALIQQYEQFWENKFRIIHMPTFWREYHKLQLDHSKAALEYPAKLLLVLLLGLQLHQSGNSDLVPGIETLPGDSGLLWLNAVEYWLFKHCQRNKPNLDLLQIHCLLTLPNRPHTTHTWHSYGTTGYLVKLATMMGLHRDPANMPHLSFAEIEMRRRLWATVLEIEISHSLDRGLMPMFTLDMFDTQPPSNLNDEDLEGENPTAMHNGPSDCWFQITLLQSLPLRLKVCQALSSPRATLTYQDAFSLDAELNDALLYLQSTSGNMISMLPEAVRGQWSARITILDLHIRRCLLAIHQAVIVNSTYQPRIYYFRVACLDSASAFLSAQTTLLPGELASSLLLSSELHAFILVCYLLTQDGWPGMLHSLHTENGPGN